MLRPGGSSSSSALRCDGLRAKGLEVYEPKGGYFVWVKAQLTMGKPGQELTINQDRCGEHTRLCFSWLPWDDLLEGLRLLEKELA